MSRLRPSGERAPLAGRRVIIVDDGIATGSTARAACAVARAAGAAHVTIAVPVAPADWVERMAGAADEYVAVATPEVFSAVGMHYLDFSQVTDVDVARCLAARDPATRRVLDGVHAVTRDVAIPTDGLVLPGTITIPPEPLAVVVFAHGSGSGRHSPRNRTVAATLQQHGLATLLPDLLTADEERTRDAVFDVELLARRLLDAVRWVGSVSELRSLRIGVFGASTGAAAALWSAAGEGRSDIAAVVSRGGRPDLAGPRLGSVTAPTLLIVGERDEAVSRLNAAARLQMTCPTRLVTVPSATHLFEEPGTLEVVAELARDWFVEHLV